jgi:hypothetical protein
MNKINKKVGVIVNKKTPSTYDVWGVSRGSGRPIVWVEQEPTVPDLTVQHHQIMPCTTQVEFDKAVKLESYIDQAIQEGIDGVWFSADFKFARNFIT